MTEIDDETKKELRHLDHVNWVRERSTKLVVALGTPRSNYGYPSTEVVSKAVDIVGEHGDLVCSQEHKVIIEFDNHD
jgi:hypothetical protein